MEEKTPTINQNLQITEKQNSQNQDALIEKDFSLDPDKQTKTREAGTFDEEHVGDEGRSAVPAVKDKDSNEVTEIFQVTTPSVVHYENYRAKI